MSTTSLQMDKPVEHSLLDDGVQDIIGKGLARVDGPLKVSGQATYAAEYDIPNLGTFGTFGPIPTRPPR